MGERVKGQIDLSDHFGLSSPTGKGPTPEQFTNQPSLPTEHRNAQTKSAP